MHSNDFTTSFATLRVKIYDIESLLSLVLTDGATTNIFKFKNLKIMTSILQLKDIVGYKLLEIRAIIKIVRQNLIV